MILYQLNKRQDVIGIASSDILSATFEEQINTAGNLKFTTAKKLRDDCLYVLFQRPNATTYMCFKILTETQEDNKISYIAVESAYDELGSYSFIKDIRPQNRTAKEMLTQILAQTRFSVGYVADTGTQSTNFYYTTVLASLQSVANLFNLEVTFDVVFDPIDNQVKKRMVNLYQQQGSRTGRRFEYGDKLLSVTCEQSSDTLVTALVGRGSSVQVSEGTDGSPDGYSRKITFADIVWKKSAGNPLDKPAGQEYLEDPAATAAYGFSDGKPRIGFVEFDKIDDKNLLIKATYDKLQEMKRPKVSFKASVTDVGNLSLGDTVAIIRHDLKIEYSTRVYKVTHDLLNRQNNTIELGDDFQKASITSTISAVQDTVQSAKEYSQSALQSANGKNTNFYGASQPLHAVEGDLWYKDLGNGETEMYQYKNGNWELITSTAELHNVQKKVDQAKTDMAQAKTDAQNAYDEAIKATGTANGAKVETAKALEQAKQANDSYTALAKEVAGNKASVDTDIAGIRKAIDANTASADADWKQAQKDYASVSDKLTETSKTVTDIKTSVNGIKTTVADNTGKISTMSQTVNSVKTSVANAQGEIATIKTDVSGTKQTVANAQKDITSIKTSVSGVQTDITNAKKDITSVKTDISGVKTSVSNVQGDVTSLKTSVSGVQADVKNAKGDITSIKTDVSGVKTTVSDHTGKITQLVTDVNGVKSSVSNKVDKTVYQSYVTQTDKALSAKLTASDLNGYAKTTDVKQTTDGLSANIAKVQGDLSSLQIGGANLLDGSSMEKEWFGYNTYSETAFKSGWTLFTSSSSAAQKRSWYYLLPTGQPEPGTYTASLDVKLISCKSGSPSVLMMILEQSSWHVYADSGEVTLKVGETVRIGITGNIPFLTNAMRLELYTTDTSFVGQIAIRHVKFEKGNKATDWCMSDNDIQSQLTTLSGKITATSDRLSSVYTKSETDKKLNTKVEQSALTQTSNNLSASIAKNSKILSSAGLVNENAYINANRIALNGKTLMTNAVIDDAFIGNLSANKITTGTLNAAKVNVINIDASKITTGTLTAVEMHQSGGGADTWINKDGIHNQMGSDNVWIKEGALAAFDSIGQGMYMESGRLTLASYAYWQANGRDDSIDYGVIKCDDDITGKKGIGIIGKGGFNLRTNNSTVSGWTGSGFIGNITAGAGIIGTDDGKLIFGSLKPTFITGGQSFADDMGFEYAPFVQVGGRADQAGTDIDKNGSSVVINAWDIKLNARGKTNRNIILNRLTYNGEHTFDLNDGTDELWWHFKMNATAFVNTSALSKKMNITKLDTQTAINAIKNTDIYDYQFKEFGETGKHYASLIIDDVNDRPQYKAAGAFVDGLGRDDGTQLGYLTVVVQSLLKEIDALKERIDK